MEWWIILSVGLVALLSLFMSGLPIYLCFLVINVTGVMLTFGQAGFGMFINSILESTSSELLTAVALFIVMGEYLFRSGAIDVAFRSCDTLSARCAAGSITFASRSPRSSVRWRAPRWASRRCWAAACILQW